MPNKRGPKTDVQQSKEAAERLRTRREALNFSVSDIANLLKLSHNNYITFEESFGPTRQRRYGKSISDILNIDIDWLITGDHEKAPLNNDAPIEFKTNIIPSKQLIDQRESLAGRLKERRKALKFTMDGIATKLNISKATYLQFEKCLPSKINITEEALLEDVLYVPRGWLRNRSISTPKDTEIINAEPDVQCHNVSEEIKLIGTWLSRENPHKRTYNYHELTSLEKRTVEIFALRYGVDGEKQSILHQIGLRYGITRERIRQITQKMVERANGLRLNLTHISRLKDKIKPYLPCKTDTIDDNLRHILGENLSILGVNRFSREILGLKIVDITDQPADMAAPWEVVVYDPETHDPEILRAARDCSHRMIRSCGAAQLSYVTGDVSLVLERKVSIAEVQKAVELTPGFDWVNKDSLWYWFGEHTPADNKLISSARKILSISTRKIDVEDIAQGVMRSRRDSVDERRLPSNILETPANIITEVLSKVEWMKRVQYDDFKLEIEINPKDVLSETEFIAYEFLKSTGGAASKYELTNQLVNKDGINMVTMSVMLDQSPIINRIDVGVYALRGWPISPDSIVQAINTVGNLQNRSKKQEVSQDHNGWMHFNYSVNESIIKRGFFDVPSNVANNIKTGHQFHVDGFKKPVTFVRYDCNSSNRFNALLSKIVSLGFGPGETARIGVNIQLSKITVSKAINED